MSNGEQSFTFGSDLESRSSPITGYLTKHDSEHFKGDIGLMAKYLMPKNIPLFLKAVQPVNKDLKSDQLIRKL